VQPFGGRGLSGTGPKAGGPLYLQRLVHAPPGQGGSAAAVDPAWSELADWLDSTGERPAAALARRIAGMVPDLRERELPGPVGERNLYALKPRGCILLKPVSRDGLFHQLAAALATGNRVAIEADPALTALLAGAPAGVRARIRPTTDQIAGALIEGGDEQIRQALRELARRPGALVLAQAASPSRQKQTGAYRLPWLLEEVSISINTTASGGNASLLAMT
jgi:RHH-type proline utilization regulon transcriptional repressor/proline dehydrogenase/delta 1-pyrroline-5-carboxylate dehydrogenase